MEVYQRIKKIKIFAVLSVVTPLVAINLCLLIFIIIGKFETDNPWIWNKNVLSETEYSVNEYKNLSEKARALPIAFTNCSKKYITKHFKVSDANIIVDDSINAMNKADSAIVENYNFQSVKIIIHDKLNYNCVKNHKFSYTLLKSFNFIEKYLLIAKNNSSGAGHVKNPYFYGEVSISRTARYFPSTMIFKPLIVLSAVFLLIYWINTLKLLNHLKNLNKLSYFSKSFFYLGVLSCVFLILHALFLGLDLDSKLFDKARRLIIISFIFFEVLAQIFLTKNLFKIRNEIKKYIKLGILKMKVYFVILILFATIVSFLYLSIGSPTTSFKHILEWNYFSVLLIYYLLSSILWRSPKT